MKLKSEKLTLKLCNGSISRILYHKESNKILISSFDGKLSLFKLEPFQKEKSFKVFNCYSTSLCLYGSDVLIGSSLGQMAHMKTTGEIIKRFKLSQECLSSIVECESHVVVSSFDGIVRFLNKGNFQIEKKIDLGTPIWNLESFQNEIYASGNPSFSINFHTFQVRKLKRFDFFAASNGKLYGGSDERGLTYMKNNSNSYIPCSLILPLKGRMMIFSQECATEIIHEHQMEWKCHRIKEIKKGTAIISGCSIENTIVLGDSQGTVYKLQYEIESGGRLENWELGTD